MWLSARELYEIRPGGIPAFTVIDGDVTVQGGSLGSVAIGPHPDPLVINCTSNEISLRMSATGTEFFTLGAAAAVIGAVSSNPLVRVTCTVEVTLGASSVQSTSRVTLPSSSPQFFGAPLVTSAAAVPVSPTITSEATYLGFAQTECIVTVTFRAAWIGTGPGLPNIGLLTIPKIWIGEAMQMYKDRTQNARPRNTFVEGILAQQQPEITQGGQDWGKPSALRHFVRLSLPAVSDAFWYGCLLPRLESRMVRPMLLGLDAPSTLSGSIRVQRQTYHALRVGELAASVYDKSGGNLMREVALNFENVWP
jgi:hypothetical protein